MFSYERNVNLEEIKTTPLLEIELLKYSSKQQLGLIIMTVVLSIGLMLYDSFVIKDNSLFSAMIACLPMVIGVLFGCQYTPELPLYLYIIKLFGKQKKTYYMVSTEDLLLSEETINDYINNKTGDIAQKEINRKNKEKRLTIIMAATAVVFISALIIFFMYKLSYNPPQHIEIDNIIVE